VYGLFQRSFPVDQHHAQPASREQPRVFIQVLQSAKWLQLEESFLMKRAVFMPNYELGQPAVLV
jgi:hypothetical protein